MAVPEVAEAVTSLPPAVVPILPVPLENVGVMVVDVPLVILEAAAFKEVIDGAATTVTLVEVVAVVPAAFVTVNV